MSYYYSKKGILPNVCMHRAMMMVACGTGLQTIVLYCSFTRAISSTQ